MGLTTVRFIGCALANEFAFRVKICGVRSPDDIDWVIEAGGDAIGLNFHPPSPRSVSIDTARALAAHAGSLHTVGVFVNRPLTELLRYQDAIGLDWIQLHGDETVEVGGELMSRGSRVVRAVRLPTTTLNPERIEASVRPWLDIGARVLLDADAGTAFGGAGMRLDWSGIGQWSRLPSSPDDWILAGGLNCDNVAEAIRAASAPAVDVASGTEIAKGEKSRELICQFVQCSLEAFAS